MTPPEYSFYLGCVIPNRYPFVEQATRNVLNELGVRLKDMQGASCCPAPGVFRSFDIPTWLAIGARNIAIAEENNADLVTMCNGCYGTLIDVDHQLKTDEKKRTFVNNHLVKIDKKFKGSIKVKHLAEVLYMDLGMDKIRDSVTRLLGGLKCAVHYGCHLTKPSAIRPWGGETEDPRFFDELVEVIGCESTDYKDKHMCCGAGGGVRSAIKEVSLDFTRHKLEMMREAGAECIVVMCPFCMLQLDLGQIEVNSIFKDEISAPFAIPVFYYTQLLGLAMGMHPNDLGLVKHHNLKGVPPFVDQEPILSRIFKELGYDYKQLQKQSVKTES
ncbi:MAG: CoB--CoM heterodisulfide reductase subunit B [Candidatus Lokiarchaeota archaeon]|nr:CoB--CoM heterodisulfide reductase subunit B [Candidatus Lokiarchaeota archaeon]